MAATATISPPTHTPHHQQQIPREGRQEHPAAAAEQAGVLRMMTEIALALEVEVAAVEQAHHRRPLVGDGQPRARLKRGLLVAPLLLLHHEGGLPPGEGGVLMTPMWRLSSPK